MSYYCWIGTGAIKVPSNSCNLLSVCDTFIRFPFDKSNDMKSSRKTNNCWDYHKVNVMQNWKKET